MTSQVPSKGTCAHCGVTTSLHCKGCTDVDDKNNSDHKVTSYCNSVCQKTDWASHPAACQAAQLEKVATKKLFRAGELLQEVFMATRSHPFDIKLAELSMLDGGKYLIREGPKPGLTPGTIAISGEPQITAVVLSCCAGGDVLAGMMHHLGKKLFQVQDSRVLVRRQQSDSPLPPRSGERAHQIIHVTLKDGSKWAVELAGAQHGQLKPVLRYAEYKCDYIAKTTACRSYGKNAMHPEYPMRKRNTKASTLDLVPFLDNITYQIDELEEWIFHNIAVDKILEADAEQYQALKSSLAECIATAALEYAKYYCKDPTSTAKPIYIIDTPDPAMSKEDRERMERKRTRRMAEMDPFLREMVEGAKAKSERVFMC